MDTRAINLVRNGNFVEGFEGWMHFPEYPDLFVTTHRGRSAACCLGKIRHLILSQTIESVEPGRYVASLAMAVLKPPPHHLEVSITPPGGPQVDFRIWYFKANWEGHWLEFDVAARGELRIHIQSDLDTSVPDNDLLLTDIAVRRLGDLSPRNDMREPLPPAQLRRDQLHAREHRHRK
jgi:hypothetical protein